MGSTAKAYLDLIGTPALLAKTGNSLILGVADKFRLRFLSTGSVIMPDSNPASGTAATSVAGGATIDTTIAWQRVTTAGAVTGVILEAGTDHGQLCVISVDKDAGGTITMAAAGTSRVGTGTGCVLGVGGGGIFVWDATDAIWSQIAEA